jgi:hypothetical protein
MKGSWNVNRQKKDLYASHEGFMEREPPKKDLYASHEGFMEREPPKKRSVRVA